jgi:hypothetical protein
VRQQLANGVRNRLD